MRNVLLTTWTRLIFEEQKLPLWEIIIVSIHCWHEGVLCTPFVHVCYIHMHAVALKCRVPDAMHVLHSSQVGYSRSVRLMTGDDSSPGPGCRLGQLVL